MSLPDPGVPSTLSIVCNAVCVVCRPVTVAFCCTTDVCSAWSICSVAGPVCTPMPTPSAVSACWLLVSTV